MQPNLRLTGGCAPPASRKTLDARHAPRAKPAGIAGTPRLRRQATRGENTLTVFVARTMLRQIAAAAAGLESERPADPFLLPSETAAGACMESDRSCFIAELLEEHETGAVSAHCQNAKLAACSDHDTMDRDIEVGVKSANEALLTMHNTS